MSLIDSISEWRIKEKLIYSVYMDLFNLDLYAYTKNKKSNKTRNEQTTVSKHKDNTERLNKIFMLDSSSDRVTYTWSHILFYCSCVMGRSLRIVWLHTCSNWADTFLIVIAPATFAFRPAFQKQQITSWVWFRFKAFSWYWANSGHIHKAS